MPWPWVVLAAIAMLFAAYQTGRLAERNSRPEMAAAGQTLNDRNTSVDPTDSSVGAQGPTGSSSLISYSGRRSDSPFTTDQFEPKRSPWTVRLQIASTEESQSPGSVETVKLSVMKDGREVESAILESGQELNANFFTKGPVSVRLECLRDWTLEIHP